MGPSILERCRILLLEDSRSDAILIRETLADAAVTAFEIEWHQTLGSAIAHLQDATPDVILADLTLPDSAGLETVEHLRNAAPRVPIVILTVMEDAELAMSAVKAGAQDWVVKITADRRMLERSLRYAVQRHRIQEELRLSEERFRQLADNVHDVFWSVDIDQDELVYVSPAYELIFGRSCESLYQNPTQWLDAVDPEQREAVRKAFEMTATTGSFDVEYRIMRPDGSVRWIHDRGEPVRDEDGRVYRVVGIAEDITRFKQLQREIADLTLEHQQRIGRELHDSLGQQLTGLALLSKALQQKLTAAGSAEAAAAEELVENVSVAQQQLRKLIKGIMPVEVDAIGLMAALEQLAKNTERLGRIECHFRCETPVQVDDNLTATQMYQIAQEAVSNAVRHASASRIDVRLASDSGALIMQIEDNGSGFAGNETGSDGMGLRIMQHRASLAGAVLEVRSLPSGGTLITCKLSNSPYP